MTIQEAEAQAEQCALYTIAGAEIAGEILRANGRHVVPLTSAQREALRLDLRKLIEPVILAGADREQLRATNKIAFARVMRLIQPAGTASRN